MAKSTAFAREVLLLIFNSIPITGLARNPAISPVTELTVALHTANPGVGGTQATSEISYTGYVRARVTRADGSGWVVTGASVSPAAAITFPLMTGGTGGVATHVSVGTGVADALLYAGALTSPITIAVDGRQPQLLPSSVITES